MHLAHTSGASPPEAPEPPQIKTPWKHNSELEPYLGRYCRWSGTVVETRPAENSDDTKVLLTNVRMHDDRGDGLLPDLEPTKRYAVYLPCKQRDVLTITAALAPLTLLAPGYSAATAARPSSRTSPSVRLRKSSRAVTPSSIASAAMPRTCSSRLVKRCKNMG